MGWGGSAVSDGTHRRHAAALEQVDGALDVLRGQEILRRHQLRLLAAQLRRALVVVGVSASVGTLLGAWAGYAGGAVDHAVSGLADLLQAFPGIVLNIAILAVVDEPGVSHVILALCVPGWVLYARIARAEAMALRQREFVEAALALGMTRSDEMSAGLGHAMRAQRALMRQGGLALANKAVIRTVGGLRYFSLLDHGSPADLPYFKHPLSLRRLALFLQDALRTVKKTLAAPTLVSMPGGRRSVAPGGASGSGL